MGACVLLNRWHDGMCVAVDAGTIVEKPIRKESFRSTHTFQLANRKDSSSRPEEYAGSDVVFLRVLLQNNRTPMIYVLAPRGFFGRTAPRTQCDIGVSDLHQKVASLGAIDRFWQARLNLTNT